MSRFIQPNYEIMQDSIHFNLSDEADTAILGATAAPLLKAGMIIYLEGNLGAGKTSLARAMLYARGYSGAVKSPTYAIVEVYPFSRLYFYHFDFYRFNSAEELLDAGLDEYFRRDSICLIEWPQKAAGILPPADLRFVFDPGYVLGRRLTLYADTPEGAVCLNALRRLPVLVPLMSSGAAS